MGTGVILAGVLLAQAAVASPAATTPAARATPVDETPRATLGGRLWLTFPTDARIEVDDDVGRGFPVAQTLVRVRLPSGAVQFLIRELFATLPDEPAAVVRGLLPGEAEGCAGYDVQSVRPASGNIVGIAAWCTPVAAPRTGPQSIVHLFFGQKDRTMQYVGVLASPEALDEAHALAERVARSATSGNQTLKTVEGVVSLPLQSGAGTLELTVPARTIVTRTVGADAWLYEVRTVVPLSAEGSPVLGIGVGGHPELRHEHDRKGALAPTTIEGHLLGAPVTWQQWAHAERLVVAETLLMRKGRPPVHVTVTAATAAERDAWRRTAETLREKAAP